MNILVKICVKAVRQHMEDGMTFDEAAALYPKLTADQIAEIKIWISETYGVV